MIWNIILGVVSLFAAGLVARRMNPLKSLNGAGITFVVLVLFSTYSLFSGMLHQNDYYIKDGVVKQVAGGIDEPPRFIGPWDRGKYISSYYPTAGSPASKDIKISVTTSDKHTFNLLFKGDYYYIDEYTLSEVQKIKDGKIKYVNFNLYKKEIEEAIIEELSNYTKEELNSKLFISEKLEQIQEDLMKKLPFKIKLYA